jgi:hypothetical protein
MAYFRPFSNIISIKTLARKKYLQYGGRPSIEELAGANIHAHFFIH